MINLIVGLRRAGLHWACFQGTLRPKGTEAMRHLSKTLLATVLGCLLACSNRANVQCEVDPNCDLTAGGICAAAGNGNHWCAYPDASCPGGYRYSGQDVGDGLAGVCVAQMPDAGIDAGTDGSGTVGPPMGWAKAFGSTGRDVFNGLALGSNDEVIAVGSFEGSVSFGGASLPSNGGIDGVVVKFDATGKQLWSKDIGGAGGDEIKAVALDQAGNVYVVGDFSGSMNIDGAALTSKANNNNAYIAKLDGTTGNRVWASAFGAVSTSDFQHMDSIALSSDGTKLAVSGQFFGTVNCGGANIAATGQWDAFVAVYATADGSHLWSRGFGGSGLDEATGVAFDGSDAVIIVGNYDGPVSFGGAQPLASHDSFHPGADVFIGRYAATNGAYVWANGYGSNGSDYAYSVRVAGGVAIVAGSFAPSPGTGISLGGDQLLSNGGFDSGFVVKYDAATGSHIWSKSLGGTTDDRALDLAVTDQVWVLDSFSGTTQIGNANYTAAGISDVAYGSLSLATGVFGTSGAFGGPDVDVGKGIGASSTALCIAGWFGQNTTSAGTKTTVFGNPLASAGMTDAFIGCKMP